MLVGAVEQEHVVGVQLPKAAVAQRQRGAASHPPSARHRRETPLP